MKHTSTGSAYLLCQIVVRVLLPITLITVMVAQSVHTYAQSVTRDVSLLPVLSALSKVSWRLVELTDVSVASLPSDQLARKLSIAPDGSGSLMRDANGRVMVYIRTTTTDAATLTKLTNAGAYITHVAPSYLTVTAFVSPTALVEVSSLTEVANIEEVLRPFGDGITAPAAQQYPLAQMGCAPATTSEGDQVLYANEARSTFEVDGTGVTIGVLSDSYNTSASSAKTAAQDIQTGDLPGSGNPCGHTKPVNVMSDYTDSAVTDEGRAMLQLVHDLAPGADLAFATAYGGSFAFADSIIKLQQSGAQIIIDDFTYTNAPFYQDGPITFAINKVVEAGGVYVTSAGNSNAVDSSGNLIGSYEAPYRPTACPASAAILQSIDCHSFQLGGADPTMGITLVPDGRFSMIFQWPQPWYGVETDFNIMLVDSTGKELAKSININNGTNGTQQPREDITYTNTTGATQVVHLVIGRKSGPLVPAMKYIFVRSWGVSATEYNATNSSDSFGATVRGHAKAKNALTVGAVAYNKPTTPQPFSSRGPATIYYGPVKGTTPAARLDTPDIRHKPDIMATDGVRTTFFRTPYASVYRFAGTSAAAPHVAAVAALMYQRAVQNGLTPSQDMVATILRDTATPVTSNTLDSVGTGVINALSAVDKVMPARQHNPETPEEPGTPENSQSPEVPNMPDQPEMPDVPAMPWIVYQYLPRVMK